MATSEKTDASAPSGATSGSAAGRRDRIDTDRVRSRAATVVRTVFTLAALFLAVGALLVALRGNINGDNAIVMFVKNVDDALDGPFSRRQGIFTFTGKSAVTKEALVNWGIAALVYLGIGQVLDRVIRPGK